jgi:hypothetical protein
MILDITSWWQGLEVFEKILWAIALLFSALFLLQTLFSFAGGGGDHDAIGSSDDFTHGDHGIGYQFFTIKNMIAFFTLFGWVGIAAYNGGIGKGFSIVLALAGGALMVVLMAILLRNVDRLKHSGTLQIKNALNQVGDVYLFIPAKRKGKGKVQIKIQGSLHELDAITDDTKDIATGSLIKVTGYIEESLLLVTANFS